MKILFFLLLFYSSFSFSKKLDLNFQQIKLSEALTVYADFTQSNLIIDNSIDEIIDLRLHQIDSKNLLNVLVEMYDLVVFNNHGITTIMKRSVYESRNQSKKFEVISIRFIDATDLFDSLKSKESNIKKGVKDSITVNISTNSLILQGKQSFIDRNKKIIKKLDVRQQQIMIKAQLYSFSKSDVLKLGALLRTVITASPTAFDQLVDLGIAATSSYSFLISKAGKFILDLEINAMNEKGNIQIISEPNIFTHNNKTASISQGVQIPYQVQDQNGAFHTEFKDASLLLQVKPRVSDSDIFLDILITKDSPTDLGSQQLSIDTRRLTSFVRIKDGDTVILGGINDVEETHKVRKVPFFSQIPYLGKWLFTSYEDSEIERDLVIFLTPQLI